MKIENREKKSGMETTGMKIETANISKLLIL